MDVVSKEQALAEVSKWLDELDIPEDNRKKTNVKPYVEAIVSAVQKGHLVFNPDGTITQKLKHPLGDGNTTEIEYDFRFEIGDFQNFTKGISETDEVEWTVARLSLVSKKRFPKALFLKLKRADYFIASRLTVFF